MQKERLLIGVVAVIVALVLWRDAGLYESVRPEELVGVDVEDITPSAAYDLRARPRWRRRGRSFLREKR